MKNHLKNSNNDWFKQRLIGAMFCVIVAFTIITLRLFYLQIICGEEFRRLSENNCIRLKSIDPPRGLIFDRDGTLLVDNRPSFDLSIVLKDAKPLKKTIKKLSKYINIPEQDLMSKIYKKKHLSYNPIVLKSDMSRNALAAVEVHMFDLPGVFVDIKPKRQYIYPKTAAHLLGYLGQVSEAELKGNNFLGTRSGDFVGKFGVEKIYEQYLRGKRGGRQVEVNATGQIVRVLKTVEAEPGNNVYLTIDLVLQQKAEELLKGVAGAVIAMDTKTGYILSLASSPSFDQNAFVSGLSYKEWNALISNPDRPMSNKAIQGEYPPASTYKIVTAIAGLEEGIIDESTSYYCPGFYKYGDRVFRCWKRGGHGHTNCVKALTESCDVYFYQVGQKLGVDRLAWYAKACGLGVKTGINLDQEANGLIPTIAWKRRRFGRPWHKGETLSIAIGQGYNLATPLQMLSLIASVANGGTRFLPLIIKSIQTASGKLIEKQTPVVVGKLPVSKKTLRLVKQGLWNVVNGRRGTARIVKLKDVAISGKTGTAQVFSHKSDATRKNDGPDHLKPHAWFVCYAPSDDPEIAVVVLIEHGEHGSSAAGPVAREFIRQYFSMK